MLYYQNQFVTVSDIEGVPNTVQLRWTVKTEEMEAKDFVSILEHFIELLTQHRWRGFLSDSRDYRAAVTLELQKWHDETIIPQYAALGIREVVVLMPEDLIADLSIRQVFEEPMAASNIHTGFFSDEGEAIAYLKTISISATPSDSFKNHG